MGWAEIGLGPRARSKESERKGRPGSVVIGPEKARQKFQTVLGLFFGRGIWICVLLIGGFIGMLVADVDRDLVMIATPFAIVALGCTLVWLSRLAYWWMHSRSSAPES